MEWDWDINMVWESEYMETLFPSPAQLSVTCGMGPGNEANSMGHGTDQLPSPTVYPCSLALTIISIWNT